MQRQKHYLTKHFLDNMLYNIKKNYFCMFLSKKDYIYRLNFRMK